MAHLTLSQREQLEALVKSTHKHTQQEKADIIGCSQTTISRELQRARPPSNRKWYTATTAQERAKQRRQHAYEQRQRWYDNSDVLRYVIEELRDGKSPDAIAGRMKRASPWHRQHTVSHESMYRYIWQVREEGGCLHLHLPRKGSNQSSMDTRTLLQAAFPTEETSVNVRGS